MEETISKLIPEIYLNRMDNQATDENLAQKMGLDLENILKEIQAIAVDIQISKDKEYRKITYGKTCAVALDIFLTIDKSKYQLVIQISKLGKFAKMYWKKKTWFGASHFVYKSPQGWTTDLVSQILTGIKSYGIRFLEDDELAEKYEGIINFFDPREKVTIDELLFCYDGPH